MEMEQADRNKVALYLFNSIENQWYYIKEMRIPKKDSHFLLKIYFLSFIFFTNLLMDFL